MEGEINRLIDMGFKLMEFDLFGKSTSEIEDAITDNDIIFIIGGQPFYLLKVVRETRFEQILKKLGNNKLYVGASAGSYLACPSMEMGLWKKPERDTYGLKDFKGMSLVEFLVFAHYEEKYKELLEEKRENTTFKIIELDDNQAISIEDKQLELIK
jgi:dipeptidase E